jgi:hypothetical protein
MKQMKPISKKIKPFSQLRPDRVQASQRVLANMTPAAAQCAMRKARAEGRTYPTSQQREDAKAGRGC